MSIDAQRVKAARGTAGRPCTWCDRRIVPGEDVSVCIACDAVHHTECWREFGGCGWGGCMNAPGTHGAVGPGTGPAAALPATALPGSPLPGSALPRSTLPRSTLPRSTLPGSRPRGSVCAACGLPVSHGEVVCGRCRERDAAETVAEERLERTTRARRLVPGAGASVAYAMMGLVVLGFIFGPVAMVCSRHAQRRLNESRRRGDDRYKGGDLAQMGLFLGVMATVIHTALLVLYGLALMDPERFNSMVPFPLPEDVRERIVEAVFGSWRFVGGE